ncbi:hypothetical protein BJY16_006194 [Actinoplanes octamycinicus]|uniref:Trypsin-like peptidase n=1 Tax=Actinoplanes octamycinicus TaxID=135948 RepID=A0A7W7H2G3_9ACTN|nr:trypsin-like peptidase domain-containing protein [Actinoplanes octamycinicus]MBB4742735.1 hypothetical protein [Actinoplanes octamycinicus]GIE63035.1 hypothetical protein Aoc01nite_84370 [Actinoplanes octamycinicus]
MDAVGRLVRDGDGIGTAFVVSQDGLAATVAHVLAGHRDAAWTFEPFAAPGVSLPVDTGLPSDEDADVALIQIGGTSVWHPLLLARHGEVGPGDPVHLTGFAAGWDFDSGVGEYVGEVGAQGRVWAKVTCRQAQPGMSGAPVIATERQRVIGLVSERLNADGWNRDSVFLARTDDLVALAPDRIRLTPLPDRRRAGTLRLSWDRGTLTPIMETDDFDVSIGRADANRLLLSDPRDSRFHGRLGLSGPHLVYEHLGSHPAHLLGADRELTLVADRTSHVLSDKDRLRFASGVLLVEFSLPDLHDPTALRTEPADGDAFR